MIRVDRRAGGRSTFTYVNMHDCAVGRVDRGVCVTAVVRVDRGVCVTAVGRVDRRVCVTAVGRVDSMCDCCWQGR